MKEIRKKYIDMVARFKEAKYISLQYPMLLKFKSWYDSHQGSLNEEEKKYLKENIKLKSPRNIRRIISIK